MKIIKKRKIIVSAIAAVIAGGLIVYATSTQPVEEKAKVHQAAEIVSDKPVIESAKATEPEPVPVMQSTPEPTIVIDETVQEPKPEAPVVPTAESLVNDTLMLYPQDKGYVKGTRACMIKYLNTYPEIMQLGDINEHLQTVARHTMIGSLTNNPVLRGVSCSEYAYLWAS